MVITYSPGGVLLNRPTSRRQRAAHDLPCHRSQTPSVAPRCLRRDLLDWHLSPAHSDPYFPLHLGLLLSISSVPYVPMCVLFLPGLCSQALTFKQDVAQLPLLDSFLYASKKQIKAPSLSSLEPILSLSTALIIFFYGYLYRCLLC